MAKRKRKRLNKRFVVLLFSVGALAVLGGLALVMFLQPKDPDRYAQQGASLLKAGKYQEAVRSYGIAATESHRPEYLLAWGDAMLECRQKDPSLSVSQRRQLFAGARDAFREALRYGPDFVEAQRRLVGTAYEIARSTGQSVYWQQYVRAVDRLLELVPDDNEVLFQRARAKERLAESRSEYVERAQLDYEDLLERAPQAEEHWLALARFYGRRGKLIWTCSKHPRVRQPAPGVCGICKRELVRAATGDSPEKAAEATYKAALAAIPKSVRIRVAYASFMMRRDKTRLAEAKGLLEEGIKNQPKNVEGYLALARYYQGQKQNDQAIKMLEEAIKVAPTDHRGYANLAYIQAFQAGPDVAEATLVRGLEAIRKAAAGAQLKDDALRKYRAGIMSLNHLLCDALLDQLREGGDREKMLPQVNSALEEMRGIHAEHPLVHKIAGRVALADGKIFEAERLLRRAYDRFGRSFEPKTAGLLIYIYHRLNQLGESQRIIERYLQVSKNDPALLLNLVRLHADYRLYDQAGRILQGVLAHEGEGKVSPALKEAARAYQAGLAAVGGKSRRIPPDVKKLDRYSGALFLRRARQLWRDGDQQAGMQLVEDLLARQPRHLSAIIQLIRWHKARKEIAQARVVLNKALAVLSDRPGLQEQLRMLLETDPAKVVAQELKLAEKISDPFARALRKAEIYRVAGKEKEFLEHLKAAEALNPKSGTVIDRMFQYALLKSDWQTAGKYAKAAAANNVDTVGGKLYEARLAAARADWDGAIRLASEALDVRPRFSRAHDFLGACYYAKGDYDSARTEYEAAYELNASNVRAVVGMVRVGEKIGTTGEYERWVTLAYRFVPNSPDIRERYFQIREAREQPERFVKRREQIRQSEPRNLPNLYRLAVLYERTDQLAKAEQVYRSIFQISKGQPKALRVLTDFLRRTNRDVQAQGMLEEYVKRVTDKVEAYLLWAEYLENAGKIDQSRAAFAKAVGVDTDGRAYEKMAQFAWRQREFAEAAEYQQKYLERAGKNPSVGSQYRLILYQVQSGQYQQAEERIGKLLKSNPSDYKALTLKGVGYFYRKDHANARQLLNQALDIKPQYDVAMRYRAELYVIEGNPSLAARDLETCVRVGARTSPQVALRLAGIYSKMGNFGGAYGTLQNLLGERPGYRQAMRLRADLCLRHERWAMLEKALADGRRAFPADPLFPEVEAEMWRRRGQAARAIAPLQEAAKLVGPERARPMAIRLAELMVDAGQYNRGTQLCNRLRAEGNLGAVGEAVAGRAHARRNDHVQAEKEFVAALKAAGRSELAAVVSQVHKTYSPPEALKKLKGWIALRPDDWQLRYLLGEMMMVSAQDYRGAAALLEEALAKTDKTKQARDRWLIYRRLAVAYDHLGRLKECRRAYEEALKFNEADAETQNNLAWLMVHRLGMPAEALPHAERAAKAMPNNPHVLDTYGLVLLLKGDLREADRVLNRSIAIKPLPASRFHLGNVYEKLGRKEDALHQYRLGWELVKDDRENAYHQELRRAVDRLSGAP